MSTQPVTFVTPEQYLEQERKTDVRSEYFRGEVFPMEAAKLNHALVVANIIGELRSEAGKQNCLTLASSLRVAVTPTGLYTYPDVTVVCGEPQFLDNFRDNLTNPKLIFEVSSPSTKDYDSGTKFTNYRTLPSLAEYITVAQDAPLIVQYVLQSNRRWILTEIQGMDQVLRLESLDLEVPLSGIYQNVKFDT